MNDVTLNESDKKMVVAALLCFFLGFGCVVKDYHRYAAAHCVLTGRWTNCVVWGVSSSFSKHWMHLLLPTLPRQPLQLSPPPLPKEYSWTLITTAPHAFSSRFNADRMFKWFVRIALLRCSC